jgi:hypothetical protein
MGSLVRRCSVDAVGIFLVKFFNQILLMLLLGAAWGCGPAPAGGAVRTYNGAASNGDSFTFSLDPAAGVLTYHDLDNGLASAKVLFTQAVDGSISFTDPTHNLTALVELPATALLAAIRRGGPGRRAEALVLALPSRSLTPGALSGLSGNFMQFRPAGGGVVVGTLRGMSGGAFQSTGYQPYADLLGGGAEPFIQAAGHSVSQGAGGDYLGISSYLDGTAYAFGNPKTLFALDTSQGSVISLPKAADDRFPAGAVGAYSALVYAKTGATIAGPGAAETGTVSTGPVTVTISGTTTRSITAVDSQGRALLSSVPLLPISSFNLTGPGELGDPCHGLFAYQIPSASPPSTQWVFVAFPAGGVVFASFTGHGAAGAGPAALYDYFYGVGVQQPR